VHVFWGDERYVPHDDPRSNYRMAKETLLDHVPCPASNIHPMPTELADPDAAAREYDATLQSYFGDGPPRFDVVLLGIGGEGHTASIFPGSPALTETTRWTLAVTTPADPRIRLTLTLPVLTKVAEIDILVAGSEKHDALAHILANNADPQRFPAAGVRLAAGKVTWWLDRPAFTGTR
jgi:6-phosphogluconolactonase